MVKKFLYHWTHQSIPLTGGGNQVNVKYTVNDPSIINQMINSVMKVYTTNGTLIKTSSCAEGLLRIKQVYNVTQLR